MARRLPGFDAVRGAAVEVRIAESTVRAFPDESIAAAALATGTRILSRSLKYHRPRTFFCLEGHCSGCLVRLDGVPNLRACQAPCAPGAQVGAQNAFPSAEVDLLGAVDFLFTRGMDHHTLMTGSSMLNKLANKVVRQLSGLGKLPDRAATELPPVETLRPEVCVIGGGAAGLAAATVTARAGLPTVVVDDQIRPGGSLRADPRTGRAEADARWQAALAAGVTVLSRATAIGYFPEDAVDPAAGAGAADARGVLAVATPDRLVRIAAHRWVWATGGYVVNLPFPDNDRPGVVAARAVGRLLIDHGILAGDKVALVEDPAQRPVVADVDALVAALRRAGADVVRVPLANVTGTKGRGWTSALDTTAGKLDCDVIAVAALPAPASEGPRQHGCQVTLDAAAGGFRVVIDDHGRTTTPNVWACGDVTGYLGPAGAAEHGARIGAHVVEG